MTREITRHFNREYSPVFPEPEGLVGRVGRLPGIDGQAKMRKGFGFAVYLPDDPSTVTRKTMPRYADPTQIHDTDPGHVEGNPVFSLQGAFNTARGEVEELKKRYRSGRVEDVGVKQRLA